MNDNQVGTFYIILFLMFLWMLALTCGWMNSEDNYTCLKFHLNNIHEYQYENDENLLKIIDYLKRNQ